MVDTLQFIGFAAAVISAGFWLLAAGIRFRPFSLFRLHGPDALHIALQRQSLLNAFAAVFAAAAAGIQGVVFFLQGSA